MRGHFWNTMATQRGVLGRQLIGSQQDEWRPFFFAALPLVCTPPCSAHATCKENNTCECNLNYEGDGITCTGGSHLCMCETVTVWAPSWPFCLLPGPLGNTYPLCDSVSLVGLLTPDLPTSQIMVWNCFCKLCCTSFYSVFLTLWVFHSSKN